jgi:isoleucyl-tRNA synthetase
MNELENARAAKLIGKSLDAKVMIRGSNEDYKDLKLMQDELKAVFMVSQVELIEDEKEELNVSVSHADGEKCERCWVYSIECENGVCPRCAAILESL